MSATSPDPIAELDLAIRTCRICRDAPTGSPLPHEPRPVAHLSATARILVAGQAPGTKVHASGLPFDDASGDRLRDWMGIGPDLFYDTRRIAFLPMGFCFPGQDAAGGDLPPRRECAPAWRARAMAAMPAVELVLAVGQYAQVWHLGGLKPVGMTETVARWREIMAATAGPRILPLPHPSWRNTGWLKRNPWFGTELLPVLRAEIARLTASIE
jgi:uracil-DNA glycosylase